MQNERLFPDGFYNCFWKEPDSDRHQSATRRNTSRSLAGTLFYSGDLQRYEIVRVQAFVPEITVEEFGFADCLSNARIENSIWSLLHENPGVHYT